MQGRGGANFPYVFHVYLNVYKIIHDFPYCDKHRAIVINIYTTKRVIVGQHSTCGDFYIPEPLKRR